MVRLLRIHILSNDYERSLGHASSSGGRFNSRRNMIATSSHHHIEESDRLRKSSDRGDVSE